MNLAAKPDGRSGGLDLAGLGSLADMLAAPAQSTGGGLVQYMDIELIDEDEANVRTKENPGFSPESIAELAESMESPEGIKVPLSLRPHPDKPGRYRINHGHRRYRAAKLKGFTKVPYFIDENFDEDDQVIENLQQEGLTARELADYIGRKLSQGWTQVQIAKRIGKSAAFVAQHVRLLNLPEPVAKAFYSGQVQDVTVANELARAHEENPEEVQAVLRKVEQATQGGDAKHLAAKSQPKITRDQVKALRKPAVKKAGKAAQASGKDADARRMQRAPSPGEDARAKEELQRQRERREQDLRERSDAVLHVHGMDALNRLIAIAQRDTGQSKRVADFLLAWWNAQSCGGFDLTDFWAVDSEVADDMLQVIGLVRRTRVYPNDISPAVHGAFKGLIKAWRPTLTD